MPKNGAKPRGKRSAPEKAKSRAGRLTEQDILDAALAFIQAEGVEALGMRSLAKKLGVTPMAIYHYVPSKEALIDRLAESMLGAVAMPEASSETWDAQLRAYALSIWDCMAKYPGLSRIALERPPIKASVRLNMYVLSVLQAAGFDQRSALLGMFGFGIYLGGAVSAQVHGARFRRKPGARRKTQRPKLPPEAQAFFALIMQVDRRDLLEFGLDTMIAGLRAQREPKLASAGATAAPRGWALAGQRV